MKKVAFALVGLAALMSTGCCFSIPKIPCCASGALVDLLALFLAQPTA
jgi:hypothetical protein